MSLPRIEDKLPALKSCKLGAEPQPVAALEEERRPDVERDTREDLTDLQQAFRERGKQEARRFTDATDSEFWCCLCFQNRQQKEEFLAAMDLLRLGDKYLDGREVAAVLGVGLSDPGPRRFLKEKPDRRLDELSHPLRGEDHGEGS